MIKLKHSIPLALLSLAGASSPACADPKYDFALHGYIRSGILANSDGNRADSVGLMPDGKWRLGNEEDTKIELMLREKSRQTAFLKEQIDFQTKHNLSKKEQLLNTYTIALSSKEPTRTN